jgi:uncharacterized Ntn-hydrolase superfamily protein
VSLRSRPRFGTFSVVACDRERGEWGVAVQSKFIAVGSVVPWAQAKVGAVATQAMANVRYGPDALRLLASGHDATDIVRRLTEADAQRDHRQLGVVDAKGGAAAFTGSKCLEWAGHEVGDGFACQGNILFGSAVVRAMARAFERTPGDLPERLLAALSAGQREGGDRRGMQSAAMLVVREKGGYEEGNDRWIDIRVDDHPSPIEELKRVFRIYDLTLLSREDPGTLVRLEGDTVTRVQRDLGILGFLTGPATGEWEPKTQAAFDRFLSENNFENKARRDGTAWPSVLHHLRERANEELARRAVAHPIVAGALDRGPGASAPPPPAPTPRAPTPEAPTAPKRRRRRA